MSTLFKEMHKFFVFFNFNFIHEIVQFFHEILTKNSKKESKKTKKKCYLVGALILLHRIKIYFNRLKHNAALKHTLL